MRRHICSLLLFVLLWSAPSRAVETTPAEEPIYQGKTLVEWIDDLKDPKRDRHSAAQALAVFGPKKEVVSALAAALKDSTDEKLAIRAAQTLGDFGPKAKDALPALRTTFQRFEEPRGEVMGELCRQARRTVAEALVLIEDHPGPEFAPILLVALQTDDAEKRRDIVIRLGKLGSDTAEVTVPALINALTDTDREVRLKTVKSLSRLGSAAKPAIHALTLALKTSAPKKYAVTWSIEVPDKHADSTRAKIPPFAYHFEGADEAMLQACAEALGRIRPESKGSIAALRRALRDMDEGVRWAALCALLESGQDASELTPILRDFLDGKDADYRRVALEILVRSGNDAKQILSALITALKDDDASQRARACFLLGFFGPASKEALPVLEKKAREDSQARVRLAALTGLAKIDSSRLKGTVRRLSAALQSNTEEVRSSAIECLTFLGPDARDALPALRALQPGSNGTLLEHSLSDALKAIEKPKEKPKDR